MNGDTPQSATVIPFPPASATFDPGAKALLRESLTGAINELVALLDALDADPDLEANGDELDGSLGEDDFCEHNSHYPHGPGCPCSDPDFSVEDMPHDGNEGV